MNNNRIIENTTKNDYTVQLYRSFAEILYMPCNLPKSYLRFKYNICHLKKVKLQSLKLNVSFWLIFSVLCLRLLFAMIGVVLVTLQTCFASRTTHYIAIFDINLIAKTSSFTI